MVLPRSKYEFSVETFAFAPDGSLYLAGYEIGSGWPDYDYSLVQYDLINDCIIAKISLTELEYPDRALGCIAVIPEPSLPALH